MSKQTTIIITLTSAASAFFLGMKCQKSGSEFDEISKPLISVSQVFPFDNDQTLYFVTKRWGVAGNHQLTALTKQKPEGDHWIPNEATDYVWQGDALIYYKNEGGRFKIWADHLPDTIKNKIANIEFIRLKSELFNQLQKQANNAIKTVK